MVPHSELGRPAAQRPVQRLVGWRSLLPAFAPRAAPWWRQVPGFVPRAIRKAKHVGSFTFEREAEGIDHYGSVEDADHVSLTQFETAKRQRLGRWHMQAHPAVDLHAEVERPAWLRPARICGIGLAHLFSNRCYTDHSAGWQRRASSPHPQDRERNGEEQTVRNQHEWPPNCPKPEPHARLYRTRDAAGCFSAFGAAPS